VRINDCGPESLHYCEPDALPLQAATYRDTWGQGADSFIAMIYERLVLMRDLLTIPISRQRLLCLRSTRVDGVGETFR